MQKELNTHKEKHEAHNEKVKGLITKVKRIKQDLLPKHRRSVPPMHRQRAHLRAPPLHWKTWPVREREARLCRVLRLQLRAYPSWYGALCGAHEHSCAQR
jgi:hypothetical protein